MVDASSRKGPPLQGHILDGLYKIILQRRDADPAVSHTAALYKRGTEKIAEKVGEEAVEMIIEAVKGKRKKLIAESADLMYHVLVLWADQGVRPEEVWRALEDRRGMSGIEEKAKRRA